MSGAKRAQWAILTVACIAVAATILAGTRLRLEDPLSTPVMAAEDPFTHLALVRSHVWDGRVEPLNPDGELYPPGMHAYVAAVWAFTGADPYDIMRFGPVVLGAIAILGMAVLLWRSDGPIAAFVAALAVAVAPEAIRRTTMMSPTALDLALVPFLLYCTLEVLKGRLAWGGAAAAISLFLVFAHPWFLTIVAFTGVLFLLIAFALPWPAARGARLSALGIATTLATVGVSWGLAVSGCGGWCGPGFKGVFAGGEALTIFGPVIGAASLAGAALLAWGSRPVDRFLQRPVAEPSPTPGRWVLALLTLIAILAVVEPARRAGWPNLVDPVQMFGWPLMILAATALIFLSLMPSPAAHMGAAIVIATLPFVIYDPFHSPFWSHRTAVYLGIGLVILAGTVGGAMARAAVETVQARQQEEARPARRSTRPLYAVAPVLIVAACLAGTVYAVTPDVPDPWYRLYEECEFKTLEEAAAQASKDPNAVVITGDWQAKVVLAALTTNASRVWYKEDFYQSTTDHEGLIKRGGILVVVDKYLPPGADGALFQQSPWQEVGRSCVDEKTNEPAVSVYTATAVNW